MGDPRGITPITPVTPSRKLRRAMLRSDVLEEATEHLYIAEAVEVVDEEEQMMMTIRQPNEGVIVFGAPLGLVLRP